jgi:hypothetical protein
MSMDEMFFAVTRRMVEDGNLHARGTTYEHSKVPGRSGPSTFQQLTLRPFVTYTQFIFPFACVARFVAPLVIEKSRQGFLLVRKNLLTVSKKLLTVSKKLLTVRKNC